MVNAKEIPVVVNAKVMNNSQDVYKEASCDNVDPNVAKNGGSVLGVMEDMIRVGKAMDYSMDGCVKDLEQQVSRKRILWDYVSTLIDRWNGEVVVLGDFNEVRNIDERCGSCFNPTSARVFDQFISASGLVDVKMEGYMFTWSHHSGSKMSKLDRFLVSEVKEIPIVVNAKVMNNSQDVYKEASCDKVDLNVVKKGGFVLGVMEDMIRVGKAMGYSMDGCVKYLERIIGTQGVGNSGDILCVWEATVFKKDYATISDNFVAIYGTWLPSNSKVLFVAIYAPHQVSHKRILWDYVLTLIDRWNGEVVVLGDFNEVQNTDERRGSSFNPTSARVFDQFISASGLIDVKMEGYTFTWSHPSGSKMSKLDRFLVSEGIFLFFPSITAVCLDRNLSDHRLIILCEVQPDFGPIPFWFYHSWISLEGFDAMVEQTWRSFSHNDANKMIRFIKAIQDLKVRIRVWIKDKRSSVSGEKDSIKKELSDIDRLLDGGDVSDSNLLRRSELHRNLYNIN
nr:RNA-directed DNA polymerase, eukaryota [Tanacetum cinerariifolium]